MPKSTGKSKPMNEKQQTTQENFNHILSFHCSDEQVPDYATPLADLAVMDSLDLMEVVVECEDSFGITITDDEFVDLKTIGQLWKIVQRETMKAEAVAEGA